MDVAQAKNSLAIEHNDAGPLVCAVRE